MNTAKSYQPIQTLSVIKGYKGQEQQLQHYVQAAWVAICTGLYNCSFFSMEETEQAKKALLRWLLQQPDADTAYSELVQRVIYTRRKQEVKRKQLPTPAEWLRASNIHGLAASAHWYQQVQQKRIFNPLYCSSIRAFAEALLAMQEEPTPINFHYWRSWFAVKQQHRLLNLFLSCLAWERLAGSGEEGVHGS